MFHNVIDTMRDNPFVSSGREPSLWLIFYDFIIIN